jgi:hypothetical protein
MKTKSKIAIALASTLVAGAALSTLPALAQEGATSSPSSSSSFEKRDHAHATISATITGIPSTVTSSHEASHGAYFTVYQLSASATAVPSTEPTTGGHRVGFRPDRGAAEPVITGTTLTATVGFRADVAGVTKYAVYPSDGSAAALVTVTVSDAGVATVTSSKNLTVAYSATVAAEHLDGGPRDGDRGGKGHGGRGHEGGKGHGGKGHGPRH